MNFKSSLVFVPLVLSSIVNRIYGNEYEYPPRVSYQPPSYVFGVVWTIIYLLYGVFIYAVIESSEKYKQSIIILYLFNLALNLHWSPLVFKNKEYVLGLYSMFILLITLVVMILLLDNTIHKIMLVPYMSWIVFAILLQIEIIRHKG